MKKIFLIALFAIMACMPGYSQLYDLVVAQDGSGDYTNIQDAIFAIRDYKPEGRQRILVKNGVYEEKIIVPSYKTNIAIIGEDTDKTVLIWHDHANMYTNTGFGVEKKNSGKEGRKIGTFQSFTLRVDGPGFECENMTIVNDAMTYNNPNWRTDHKDNVGVGQAVAVHVEGDRAVFRNCKILGFQDTVFNGNEDSRQMFYNCYIEGTVDFIFGPATVWFEQCTLHSLNDGYYTAASTPANHAIGYVFNKCRFTAEPHVKKQWLGRPWRNYAAVFLKECEIPACVDPAGWDNWRDPEREKTARFYEYKNSGPGADRSKRVAWSRELDATNAAHLTVKRVFQRKGDSWTTNAMPSDFQRLHYAFCDEFRGKGSAYLANTLEPKKIPADPVNAVEDLVIRLDSLDCTTFVEYLSAAILGRIDNPDANDSIMQRFVQALRYRDGKRGNYATRKHYFTDWIRDNVKQGSVSDITGTFEGSVKKKKVINFMSTHPQSYPQLAACPELLNEIKKVEAELSSTEIEYVPLNKIVKNYNKIREGDIIAFMTSINGLDVQHVGFIWRPDPEKDRPQLFHASSANGRVLMTNATLADYAYELKNCIGIKVIRLNAK